MTNAYGFYGSGNAYMSPQPQMANFINPHSPYFNQAIQQAVALNNPHQQQMQPVPQQQQIATQPPIMQNMQGDNRNSARMLYVGNKEEATAHPVDLIYNTPTFFYNRGTNEVYMKQYDGSTGNAKFKIYTENSMTPEQQRQPQAQPQIQNATIAIPNDNAYMNELKMIRAGIDGLYRYLNYGNQTQPQQQQAYSQNYHNQQLEEEEEYENDNNDEEIIDVDFVTSTPQKTQPKQNKGKVNGK